MIELIQSQKELAIRYGVKYRTTVYWIDKKGLKFLPQGGSRKKFIPETVDQFLRELEVEKIKIASPTAEDELKKFKTKKVKK